jgi:hypothetical protein
MRGTLSSSNKARPVVGALLAVALAAVGLAIVSGREDRASAAPITKVLWILEENSNPESILGSCATCQQLPYLNSLATTYGRGANVRSASVPSLPNYIAVTSGDTWGIADDNGPARNPLTVPSIFDQLPAGQARVFAESMNTNCQLNDSARSDVNGAGYYSVRHTAWPYYVNTSTRSRCQQYQVRLAGNLQPAIDNGLPALSIVVPANCNNFHKGGTPDVCTFAPGQTYYSRADAWLQTIVPQILAGPDWQAGRLAIFIAWDEGTGASPADGSDCTTSTLKACRIPLVVMSPGTNSVVDSTPYTTYSLLRTTEELLGLPLLGRAATAASMRAGFGLGGGGTPPPPPTTTGTTTATTGATTTTSSTSSIPGGVDTTPPTGAVTVPTNGATVSGTLNVTVSASDNVGVVKVNMLLDNVRFATVKTAPFTYALDTRAYSNGSHTLYAKIYDAANNETRTATVTFTIQN